MTIDGLQLPGLMRADPGHIALYRVKIGAQLAIPHGSNSGFIRVDVKHHSAARFILVVSESVDKAAVNFR